VKKLCIWHGNMRRWAIVAFVLWPWWATAQQLPANFNVETFRCPNNTRLISVTTRDATSQTYRLTIVDNGHDDVSTQAERVAPLLVEKMSAGPAFSKIGQPTYSSPWGWIVWGKSLWGLGCDL
jgi:hypothetical protein